MDEILTIAICLLLNALLAAYEMAFISIPRSELRRLAKKENLTAKKLIKMRDNPERTLSIIQIGITLVGAIAAAVGGAGAAENIEPFLMHTFKIKELTAEILSVILVVLPITYLSVVIGELVPKTLALRAPLKIVMNGAKPLFIADKVLSPMITVLEWSTKKILKLFFKKSKPLDPAATSQTTIELDQLSPIHQKFVLNMFEIEKRKIKDIMLPWSQVDYVNQSSTIDEVNRVVLGTGYTRFPVFDNGRVTGVLHTKEFVTLKESGEKQWQSIIRVTLKVLPTDSALGVLRMMQERRNHLAVVFSPLGEILGIITMEDILEEVVGEIYDEDDDERVRKIFASKSKLRNHE